MKLQGGSVLGNWTDITTGIVTIGNTSTYTVLAPVGNSYFRLISK